MRTVKKDKKTPKSGKRTKEHCGLVSTERLEIPVHKYDAEVFGMLIQFIHSGTAYITAETVTGEFNNLRMINQKEFPAWVSV